jgi:Protein of unknown function (DUF3096)
MTESRVRIPAAARAARGAVHAVAGIACLRAFLGAPSHAGRSPRPRTRDSPKSASFGPIEQQRPTAKRRGQRAPAKPEENDMEIIVLQPIVALIAGILILIMPHLLNYIVAIYLIVIGLVGLLNHLA